MMDYIGVVGDSCLVYASSAGFVFCFILLASFMTFILVYLEGRL